MMRFILISFLCAPLQLASQDPYAIILKAEDLLKGETSHGIMSMSITTPDFTRTMKMESWNVGNDKALIVMLEPKREQGNRTLKIGNELWMYLRSTETTIKIPPSMMLQSWNGSDFTFDDLVRESNLNRDYEITLTGTEKIEGADTWIIQLIPKPRAPVVWGKLVYWVRQSDYVAAKIQFFDERNILTRTMEFRDIATIGGRKVPRQWRMINELKPDHRTELVLHSMEFDLKIPARIFTLRSLER